jgi:hypothetical protein
MNLSDRQSTIEIANSPRIDSEPHLIDDDYDS